MMKLTSNSQAIILLTSKLIGDNNIKPLSISEYEKLSKWLYENKLSPQDLMKDYNIIHNFESKTITKERIKCLFSRGNAMALALKKWQDYGIYVLTRADSEYPKILKSKLNFKSPPILYMVGNIKLLEKYSIAIVGSRNAKQDDLYFSYNLGKQIAFHNKIVISGAAKGIDEASMFGSLENGGCSIGVLAEELAKISISKKFRNFIINDQLLLLSPYDPFKRFETWSAMDRNKYIYALSRLSIVICSEYNKGGTWTGAVENMKYNFSTMLVKNNNSSGNMELIKNGCCILDELKIFDVFKQEVEKISDNIDKLEEKIILLLKEKKLGIREIAKEFNNIYKENEIKKKLEKLLNEKIIEKNGRCKYFKKPQNLFDD